MAPRRRRFQFSLASLLALTTAAAVIAWLAAQFSPATQRYYYLAAIPFVLFGGPLSVVYVMAVVLVPPIRVRAYRRRALGSGEEVMRPRRRWFQFSLRSFLVLLTAFAVWLGVVVNRAREQREAVKAIETLGGKVRYDWQTLTVKAWLATRGEFRRPGPAWLRQFIGDDFFQNVETATLSVPEEDALTLIPHLQRLRRLRLVHIDASERLEARMKTALPACKVHVWPGLNE